MSEGYIEDTPQIYEGEGWAGAPVPVTFDTEETAPEYSSNMTYIIPQFGVNPCIQILTRRIRRTKAYVEVNFTVAGSVIFNSKIDSLSVPQGYTVAVPVAGLYRLPDWESQQPLYVIATVAGLTCSVIDQSYADR